MSIHEYVFENVVCKVGAILASPHMVNTCMYFQIAVHGVACQVKTISVYPRGSANPTVLSRYMGRHDLLCHNGIAPVNT